MAIEEYIETLLEKHLPVAFIGYSTVMKIKELILNKEKLGRKEVLIFAYLIGASSAESNKLLEMFGHPLLYVKKREDAVWKYALDNQVDCASVIEEIFLQNVDEKIAEKRYIGDTSEEHKIKENRNQ